MKARPWLPLVIVLLAAAPGVEAVQLGDTREMVVEEMGPPKGEIGTGSVTVLFFSRGEIQLRDGAVSAIDLVSEDELEARQAALAEEMARLEVAREERNARLEAEGRAELEARQNDPGFVALSASEQLAYWRTFAARYPMISIADELAALRERFDQEQRLYELEIAHQQRMAELEQRLADAEDRAARAERLARNRSGYRSGPWFPGFSGSRRNHQRHDPDFEPHATPPADDLRAEAMAGYDEGRRQAYATADGRPQR